MMQNNFTWYLKFHAGGSTIFSQVQFTVEWYPYYDVNYVGLTFTDFEV